MKVEGVLVCMLAVVVALIAYFVISAEKDVPGAEDLMGKPSYVVRPSADSPVNNIGAQHSSQQRTRNRKLDAQMMQFLDLRHVE